MIIFSIFIWNMMSLLHLSYDVNCDQGRGLSKAWHLSLFYCLFTLRHSCWPPEESDCLMRWAAVLYGYFQSSAERKKLRNHAIFVFAAFCITVHTWSLYLAISVSFISILFPLSCYMYELKMSDHISSTPCSLNKKKKNNFSIIFSSKAFSNPKSYNWPKRCRSKRCAKHC